MANEKKNGTLEEIIMEMLKEGKDDITAVIVAKIKKKRDNNEKIGQLLKTYGVAQLSDLPAEKYEAFLADVSQI